jgi:hypothetical protein
MKNELTVAAWLRIKPTMLGGDWDEYDFSANEQPGFDAPLVRLADAQALLDEAAKDTAAIIEIDRVMLESGADWPDLETDALVVRSVKQLTRMLNAERAEVQALRDQVRLAYMSGTDNFRRHYDADLFAVIGVKGFRDLYAPAGSVPAPDSPR